MSENICWDPTRIYIKCASFQNFHQWHLLTSSKMPPSKLYADDSTMYTLDKLVSTIVVSLRHEFIILSKWFYNNLWFLTQKKGHLCC